MKTRRAFVNCTVYLGRGVTIERGFVAWREGRIEEVGPLGSFVRGFDTEVTDLHGKLLLPGLVDCHLHLVSYARSLIEPDLAQTRSVEEALGVVRSHLAGVPRGEWLFGRGWDKQRWALAELPTRQMLDTVSPDNPVSLTSRDGHAKWINTAALQALGLADRAVPVDGGEIVVDAGGRPTGIFKENAAGLVSRPRGADNEGRLLAAITQACERLARFGLTGVHTIETAKDAALLTAAVDGGRVPVKLFRLREVLEPQEIDALAPSPDAACIKAYADGALGSQTASMFEPYCGQPDNAGILVAAKGKLLDIATRAVTKGFAVAVHAIGDRANREVLDAYDVLRKTGGHDRALLRIEHAQVLCPEDVPRFGALRVVASMQPIHLLADRPVAEKYWGARSRNAYAWKRIMEAGGKVAFGSDAPIESPDPLAGIHAAVMRRDPATQDEPWYPNECIEPWQAIDCYTLGAAEATGGNGSELVKAGARPDFTIIDRNILAPSSADAIPDARATAVVIGGEPHFSP